MRRLRPASSGRSSRRREIARGGPAPLARRPGSATPLPTRELRGVGAAGPACAGLTAQLVRRAAAHAPATSSTLTTSTLSRPAGCSPPGEAHGSSTTRTSSTQASTPTRRGSGCGYRRARGSLARRADAVVTVSPRDRRRAVRRHRLAAPAARRAQLPAGRDTPTVAGASVPLRAIYQAAIGPGRDLLGPRSGREHPGRRASRAVWSARTAAHRRMSSTLDARSRPDDLVAALAPFDVGLVIDRPATENTRLALPNKLFEYLMAGLAVVVPDAPAMAALVEREGVGRDLQPGRPGRGSAPARRAIAPRRRGDAPAGARAALERYNAEAQAPGPLRRPGGSRMCGICGVVELERPPETATAHARCSRSSRHRGPDGEGIFEARRRRARPRAPRDHRPHRRRAAAVRERGRSPAAAPQRRDLQLRRAARRARAARPPLPQRNGHRGRPRRLRAMGRGVRRALQRHVGDRALGRPRAGGSSAPATASGSSRSTTAGTGRRFVFASEPRAFRRAPGIRLEPNRVAVRDFIEQGYTDHRDETFFAGIRSLPPAHSLVSRRATGCAFTGTGSSDPGRAAGRPRGRGSRALHRLHPAPAPERRARSAPRSQVGWTRRPSR